MNLESNFETVRRFVKNQHTLICIGEVLVGFLAAATLGSSLSGHLHYKYTIVLFLIYLPLIFIRFHYNSFFPESLFEELKSKLKVTKLEGDVSRKEMIYEYFNHAIEELNHQTCTLSHDDDILCKQTIQQGMTKLLDPLVKNPQYILQCCKSKFSVGIINIFPSITKDNEGKPIIMEDYEIIFLRDDLEVNNYMSKSILYECGGVGISFHIRNVLQEAFNSCVFKSGSVTGNNENFYVCASPIPQVCEDGGASGVLFLISQCIEGVPKDTGNVLLVFSRIISNWVAKYTECSYAKDLSKNGPSSNDPIEDDALI
jgi:hypothetical protein